MAKGRVGEEGEERGFLSKGWNDAPPTFAKLGKLQTQTLAQTLALAQCNAGARH